MSSNPSLTPDENKKLMEALEREGRLGERLVKLGAGMQGFAWALIVLIVVIMIIAAAGPHHVEVLYKRVP